MHAGRAENAQPVEHDERVRHLGPRRESLNIGEIGGRRRDEPEEETRREDSPPEAKEFEGVEGKFEKYFSKNPGTGD